MFVFRNKRINKVRILLKQSFSFYDKGCATVCLEMQRDAAVFAIEFLDLHLRYADVGLGLYRIIILVEINFEF